MAPSWWLRPLLSLATVHLVVQANLALSAVEGCLVACRPARRHSGEEHKDTPVLHGVAEALGEASTEERTLLRSFF